MMITVHRFEILSCHGGLFESIKLVDLDSGVILYIKYFDIVIHGVEGGSKREKTLIRQ